MKTYVLWMACILGLAGCAGVNDKEAEHGGLFRIDSIAMETDDIDGVFRACDDPPTKFEPLVKSVATVTLRNAPLNPQAGPPPPVRLKSYTLVYEALDGGPALAAVSNVISETATVPSNGTLAIGLIVVPIRTKLAFQEAYLKLTKPSVYQYNVTFTIEGESDFGIILDDTATTTIQMADFDNC
jgi:hypothetical protein